MRNLLARWDAFWYLDIASRGYHWNGNPLEQQNVVFFPLFPLLMRAVGAAIGGHPLLAGLLVSLAAFLLALSYFWRWTADRLGADAATGAVWLLSAFPSAIFFSAVYTESLYLLIVVAACYYAERRQFARSAIAWDCWPDWSGRTDCCCRSRWPGLAFVSRRRARACSTAAPWRR